MSTTTKQLLKQNGESKMSNENVKSQILAAATTTNEHLIDIDSVLCDTNANMGNIVSALGRIAMAMETLVEQGKTKPVIKEVKKKVTDKPVKKELLYWYHAESDACGIAKNEDDLLAICNADGLGEPCTKEIYDRCNKENNKPVEEVKTFTHADLKNACLVSARADSDNRAKLKALLKTYGAVKAVDVPEDKIVEVIGKIEAGDF